MLKRACVVIFLLMTLAGPAWSADDTFVMPTEMQKLMPAEPAFLAVITSVNELDRHWGEIEAMLDEESGEGTDILGLLSEYMPGAADQMDLDMPVAVIIGVPNPMAGEEPPVTLILPVNDTFDEEALADLELEEAAVLRQGDYLALSMDPNYLPAEELPALAQGMNPGFFSLRLDLEMIIAALRPLAEMGIAAMTSASAVPDTAGGAASAPATDPEEAEALRTLLNAIMDSARRFDLACSVEGDELTFFTGFAVHPGSPLDTGPQPSFEEALQLTRLLPEGGNIIQAMALDQTRQFEVLKPTYLMSMEQGLGELPPEQAAAYRAWVESYLGSLDLFARPLAATIGMSDGGMNANLVMASPDPAADLARFSGLFAELSEADIGVKVKKMPTGKVSGVEVHSWTVVYDADKLAGFTTDPMNPQMGGTGRMQAEQMIGFLRKVTPNLNMAVRGEYLIFSADQDPSKLAHMIQEAGQRRGAAIPEVAAVAAKAGPTCQQVVTGDLMAVIAWVTEWMEETNEEEYAAIQGNPIPFTSAFTIDNGQYGVAWTMDMPAVKQFISAIQELEAMDDARKENAEDAVAPEAPDSE